MSIGLRDQRVEVFAMVDSTSAGYTTPTPTLVATRWGRVEAPNGRESFAYGNGLENQVIDAIVVLGDDVTVSPESVVRVGGSTGQVYRVLSVLPRRRLREIHLVCGVAEKQTYALP